MGTTKESLDFEPKRDRRSKSRSAKLKCGQNHFWQRPKRQRRGTFLNRTVAFIAELAGHKLPSLQSRNRIDRTGEARRRL